MAARRSALLTRFSIAEIVMRADTPEFWSTNSLFLASTAISSMTSLKNSGIAGAAPSRPSQASCDVIFFPASIDCG